MIFFCERRLSNLKEEEGLASRLHIVRASRGGAHIDAVKADVF